MTSGALCGATLGLAALALPLTACSDDAGSAAGSSNGGAEGADATASTAPSGGSSTGASSSVGGASTTGGAGGSSTGGAPGGSGGADGGNPGAAGSAGAPTDAGTENGGPIGTGPGDWLPGDYPPDIHAQTYREISGVPGQGAYIRQYKVHVPPSYDPTVPMPLVFCIHGLSQNAVMFCVDGAAMDQLSDQKDFILVMPNGYQASWNGGTCCGAASNERLDDVALIRAIFDEVSSHVNVDLRRVYATGLSNGGFLSYRLGCEAADLFAAIAPSAGSVGTNDNAWGTTTTSDFTSCDPSQPISVLDVHGTADTLVPYSYQAPSLDMFVAADGCDSTTVPAAAPPSGGDTTCVTYEGCPAGIEITGCSIEGGGHCWFGSPDCGTGGGPIGAAVVGANSDTMKNNQAIWDFFVRNHR